MALKSFNNAISGLKEAIKSQKNLRFHFIAGLIVFLTGLFFNISLIEWIILLLLIMAMIACELFNTAIEYTVDIASPGLNELAKKAKDISAAAVFVVAIIAAVIGLLIFSPYFLSLIIS